MLIEMAEVIVKFNEGTSSLVTVTAAEALAMAKTYAVGEKDTTELRSVIHTIENIRKVELSDDEVAMRATEMRLTLGSNPATFVEAGLVDAPAKKAAKVEL